MKERKKKETGKREMVKRVCYFITCRSIMDRAYTLIAS